MRVLVLDASGARGLAAVVLDGVVVAERSLVAARGIPAALPALAQAVLAAGEVAAGDTAAGQLDLVATVVGPGSFTGIRAALALAHGISLGSAASVVGVTVGEALEGMARPRADWVASGSRRGRVFLERGSIRTSESLDALPWPDDPRAYVAISGALAIAVASRLAARGVDVQLMPARWPGAAGIAAAAVARARGGRPSLPLQPLYIDPPDARLPAGLRPAPG